MTDEIEQAIADNGDRLAEPEPKEPKEKPRVSFNRDVHVKRFGESVVSLGFFGLLILYLEVSVRSVGPPWQIRLQGRSLCEYY